MNDKEFDLFDEAPVVEDFSDLKPEIPKDLTPAKVVKEAEKVSKTISKTKAAIRKKAKSPGFERILEILSHDPELNTYPEPPTEIEVRNDGEHAPILDILQEMVDKYKNEGFDVEESDADVLRMSAYLGDLSKILAVFQAQVEWNRNHQEDMRINGFVKAKKAAAEEGIRLTDEDAKHLSKFFGLPLADRAASLEYISKYLYNAFHSIRTFTEILNFVTARRAKVERLGPQL